MLNRLKSLAFDNFVIKAFSLIFAVVLWYHVVAKGNSEVNFVVPLELKDIPKNMVVVGEPPAYIDVRLLGGEGMLKSLSPRDISAAVNLAGAKEGEFTYDIGPSDVSVPGNITVSSVRPPEVKLRLETLTERVLPVVPVVTGKPGKGFQLGKADVVPEMVAVRGPKSLLPRIDFVHTEAVDITGATRNTERTVGLEVPAMKGVVLGQDSVSVQVTLTKAKK